MRAAVRWLWLLLLLLLVFGSRVAAAQSDAARVALDWRIPDASGCTTAEEIQRRVAHLTEQSLRLDQGSDQYRIKVELTPERGSWRAFVSLTSPAGANLGSREMHGRMPDCDALDVSVVLVIATMLDDLRERTAQAAQSGDGAWPAAISSTGIGVSASAATGFAPSTWFGLTLSLEVPLAHLPLAIDASAYWPQQELDSAGHGARATAVHAGLGLCPHLFTPATVDLQLCIGAQAGGLWAEGVGLTESASGVLPRVLIGAEPKLLLKLADSLAFAVSLNAAWVPVREPFTWMIGKEVISLEGGAFVLLGRIGFIKFLR